MNLGENIYTYRMRNHMSQGDLAAELDVSRQSVSKWENNSVTPELDKLVKLTALFGISLDELVFGKEEFQEVKKEEIVAPLTWHFPSKRVLAGAFLLFFGSVFLILSLFWGDRLRCGEVAAEVISCTIILLSIALMATYNFKVWGFCTIIYMLYAFLAFAVFHVTSVSSYIFVGLTGAVLMFWFLYWGVKGEKTRAAKEAKKVNAAA